MVAFVLLGLGIFLLLERMQIKATVWRWLLRLTEIVSNAASTAGHWIAYYLRAVEKSDLVGGALILIAVLMIAYSLRARLIRRHAAPTSTEECPKCGAHVRRAPRRLAQRLLEAVLWIRIRRYACSKCSYRASAWNSRREVE